MNTILRVVLSLVVLSLNASAMAAEYATQTLNMASSTGYVVTLANPLGSISIAARAECYISLVGEGAAPAVPTSSAVPAVGTTTNFFHLLPGEILTTGIDAQINQQHEFTKFISVWSVGTGNLTWVGVVHK